MAGEVVRVLIEVVADDREDAVTLLRGAVQAIRWEKERSGEPEHSCLGDYRITVTDDLLLQPPYEKGDRVTCVGEHEAHGLEGTVDHSGPLYTGVRFVDRKKRILKNELLARVTSARTLGVAVLRFAVGDRVRLIGEDVSATSSVFPEVEIDVVPPGTIGRIEECDSDDKEGEWLVVWEVPGEPWSWLASADLDVVPVSPPSSKHEDHCAAQGCEQAWGHAPPCDRTDLSQPCVICGKPSRMGSKHCSTSCAMERVRRLNAEPQATCPCGDPVCPTGPECFGGSDYP